jgi:thioredoxin-related protein
MRAEPIVNGLKSEWAGSVDVLQVNVLDSANLDLIDRLGARFTPTFVLFDAAGQEVWRSVGNINAEEVRSRAGALVET